MLYQLKKEWQHQTLEEVFNTRLMEALSIASRTGSQLAYSRIPGLLADCLDVVPAKKAQETSPKGAQ